MAFNVSMLLPHKWRSEQNSVVHDLKCSSLGSMTSRSSAPSGETDTKPARNALALSFRQKSSSDGTPPQRPIVFFTPRFESSGERSSWRMSRVFTAPALVITDENEARVRKASGIRSARSIGTKVCTTSVFPPNRASLNRHLQSPS